MTQQNAALVEQSAAAAESLREQAQKLSSAVAGFKLDGHASTARAPHGADAPRLQPTDAPTPSVHAVQAQQAIQAARRPATKPAPAAAPAAKSGGEDDWESF